MPGEGIRVQADEGAGGRAAPLLRVQPAGRGGQRQLQGHHHAPHWTRPPSDGNAEMSDSLLVSYVEAFFLSNSRSFIHSLWTWLQSLSAIPRKAGGGTSHSSTDLSRDTNLAHSWASLLQVLLQNTNEKSTKHRLRSSICCSSGPTSELWREGCFHRFTSTWQSYALC